MVRKGSTLSEEARRKISESLKGRPGRKHTKEAKRKMSEKKKQLYKENPDKVVEALEKARRAKGPVSEETRRKLSEAGKRRYQDPLEREKQSERQNERWTDEAREAVKEERRARWENPEFRERVITSNTGKKLNKETKYKIAEKAKDRWSNPEFKEKMKPINKEAAKKRDMTGARNGMYGKNHSDEARLKMTTALWKRLKDNLTPLELIVARTLDSLDIIYEPQKIIGFYVVDFHIPSLNSIIEVDGAFWHNKPDKKDRDQRRDHWLRSKGYKVIRLSEASIKEDPLSAVTSALNNFKAD